MRVLTPDDWPLWRDLRLAALAEAPDAFGSSLADWTDAPEQRWRDRLALPGSHNLAAILDCRPAGMASGLPGQDGVAELISMWVAPHARGHGVGDALVAAVVAWAAANGAAAVELNVVETNAAATALYERHGFAVTGAQDELLRGTHRELVMTRRA